MGLGDVAGLGQQQGHGVLGHRHAVGPGRVDDHHAPLGRRGQVDVVDAGAGPAHDDEVVARLEDGLGHLGRGPDDEGVGALDGLDQLVGGQAESFIDVVPRFPHRGEASLGQLLGDQDPGHPAMIVEWRGLA